MTVWMATCRKLCENPEVVGRLAKNYWEIEKNGTPVVVLLPWFQEKETTIYMTSFCRMSNFDES